MLDEKEQFLQLREQSRQQYYSNIIGEKEMQTKAAVATVTSAPKIIKAVKNKETILNKEQYVYCDEYAVPNISENADEITKQHQKQTIASLQKLQKINNKSNKNNCYISLDNINNIHEDNFQNILINETEIPSSHFNEQNSYIYYNNIDSTSSCYYNNRSSSEEEEESSTLSSSRSRSIEHELKAQEADEENTNDADESIDYSLTFHYPNNNLFNNNKICTNKNLMHVQNFLKSVGQHYQHVAATCNENDIADKQFKCETSTVSNFNQEDNNNNLHNGISLTHQINETPITTVASSSTTTTSITSELRSWRNKKNNMKRKTCCLLITTATTLVTNTTTITTTTTTTVTASPVTASATPVPETATRVTTRTTSPVKLSKFNISPKFLRKLRKLVRPSPTTTPITNSINHDIFEINSNDSFSQEDLVSNEKNFEQKKQNHFRAMPTVSHQKQKQQQQSLQLHPQQQQTDFSIEFLLNKSKRKY